MGGHLERSKAVAQGQPNRVQKKTWQKKGGRPRLKAGPNASKKGRASVEDEVKGLRRLHLQAIKDLRQALRNARQFEVRKVCRRIRGQEEKCHDEVDKDAAAALQKGLAKLGEQLEALKAVSVPLVLPRAVAQAEVPSELLRDGLESDSAAATGKLSDWAVGRLLAAHCVQQVVKKVRDDAAAQKQAIDAAQQRKEKREAERQAREAERMEEAVGTGHERQKRKADEALGDGSDGDEGAEGGSSVEDEGAAAEIAASALARLQQLKERRKNESTAETDEDSSAWSDDDQFGSGSDAETGRADVGGEGVLAEELGSYSDLSGSGSESEEEIGEPPSKRGMRPQKNGAAKAKPVAKKKNRLGQRERRRLAAATAPTGSRNAHGSSRPQSKGPQKWSGDAKRKDWSKPAARQSRSGRPHHQRSDVPPTQAGSKKHTDSKESDLHPSWAAKKAAASVVAPFAGKKVVFDDDGRGKSLAAQGIKVTSSRLASHTRDNKAEALHPSWAAKKSQAQKLSLTSNSSSAKKIKFDD